MSALLVGIGAGIFGLLGLGHLVFTLQSTPNGGPMMPTDPDVLAAMDVPGGLGLAPHLKETLYRAWIGFNLSHSLGVVLAAAIMLRFAISDFKAALDDPTFLILVIVVPAAYGLLAVKFWFDQPRNAIVLATALVWAGTVLGLI